MLANAINQAYCASALAKSSAGINTPTSASAIWRSIVASFLRPKFNGGRVRGSFERRSRAGSVNSDSPATLLFNTNVGSSLNLHEEAIMDDARIQKAVHLFSQLPYRKQFIYLSIFKNPKLLKILDSLPREYVAVISEHMGVLVFGEAVYGN